MSKILTLSIRKLLHSFGYEIVKLEDTLTTVKVGNWLQNLDIQTIIDIGSNTGQFIHVISKTLPGRQIYAFEPIKSCYDQLVANTKQYRVTAYNFGLSDSEGASHINVSENFYSSSLLQMDDLHKELYPESAYKERESITLKRLDDVMSEHDIRQRLLIKMDVQGYEEKVLDGAGHTIQKAAAVIVETSFSSLYQGQWLFHNVYEYFASRGFSFHGFSDQSLSKKSGIPLYGDGIFVKKSLADKIL